MNSQARMHQSPGLEIVSVADDFVVHDPVGAKVHVLNRTAGEILHLCDGERRCAQIAAEISSRTGGGTSQVESDVERIIGEFQELGLVQPSANPGN